MALDRTTIQMGSGHIVYAGKGILSAADITVTLNRELFDVVANGYGKIDGRKKDFYVEVTCTPLEWDNLGVLFPYAAAQVGSSVCGEADRELSVIPRTGDGIKLPNAIITEMPALKFSAQKPVMEQMKFRSVIKNNGDPALSASYFAKAAAGTLPSPRLDKIPNAVYLASWGDVLKNFGSEEGFSIKPNVAIDPVQTDDHGIVDYIFTDISATCSVTPVGITYAALLDALGGESIGGSPAKNDLTISGQGAGTPVVTLKNTLLQSGTGRYADKLKRIGEVQFHAVRRITNGLVDPLWEVA